MTAVLAPQMEARLAAQPDDVRLLLDSERDQLIISAVQVDGIWITTSQYGDHIWRPSGGPTNRNASRHWLNFGQIPSAFRSSLKEVMYRYMRRGVGASGLPVVSTIARLFNNIKAFLLYLDRIKIKDLAAVTPMVCANYAAYCKESKNGRGGKPLKPSVLFTKFSAVSILYELSHFTSSPIELPPWGGHSGLMPAGMYRRNTISKTPLIPDEIFCSLFREAYDLVKNGNALLEIRDELETLADSRRGQHRNTRTEALRQCLNRLGWSGTLQSFRAEIYRLRTACYIVVASLSGCRNHELAYVQTDACYRTEDDDGEVYWWMRSQSDKTGAGKTEWMVPEAAVEALRVMDRWAVPYQKKLKEDIDRARSISPHDPWIAEASRHVAAVFLGMDSRNNNEVRTTVAESWSYHLNAFARHVGINWHFSSHQFRRKFANYAARSRFGDLRYLREHFKHWSQDMTNDGYALNESQEMELYAEISEELEGIKLGLAEQWLRPNELLAGGYGKNLMDWRTREENIAIFKDRRTMVASVAASHAIRSNGHAWCTADDNQCIGNTLEKTRCSGCDNAVIGRFHARIYKRLYGDLKVLAECDDIGSVGQARVLRDLSRCRDVLISLGFDPEAKNVA